MEPIRLPWVPRSPPHAAAGTRLVRLQRESIGLTRTDRPRPKLVRAARDVRIRRGQGVASARAPGAARGCAAPAVLVRRARAPRRTPPRGPSARSAGYVAGRRERRRGTPSRTPAARAARAARGRRLARRAASARSSARALAPRQPARRRRAPGGEVARRAPRRDRQRRRRRRLALGERVVERRDPQPGALGLGEDRREPRHALVPVQAEQLGVERHDAEAAVAHARRGRATKSARVRRAPAPRARRVVGRAVDRPRLVAVLASARRVSRYGAARRVAAVAPDQLEHRAVDRHEQRARPASAAAAAARRPRPSTSVRSTHVACTPASSSSGSSHGACAHSGSQSPPRPAPRPRAVRGDARRELQPHAARRGQQREDRMRRRRGPASRGRRAAPARSPRGQRGGARA